MSHADVAAAVALAVALVVWAGPLTHSSGGRDAWVLALGLLSLLPALVLLRPWKTVPRRFVLVAASPALAALVVCLTAPTGFDGLDETASLAYCGGLYCVMRAWAVDGSRRRLILLFLAVVGLEQFSQAYLPWWGSGSVATQMTGTFYWHNQFAAFMLATGLVAGVLAVRGAGPIQRAGWLVAPWCVAGLLFSGSRASLAILALTWTIVMTLSFLDRRGRVASLALVAVSLGLATLLTSPLLMEDAGGFGSTVEARESEQSVAGNGAFRLVAWRGAAELGLKHPVTGAGFDSFGSAGSALLPAEAQLSVYVHNGYLQAFSDGGLLLLVAVTATTGLPLLAAFRCLLRRRRSDDVLAVAVSVALTALVLHSGVDFDWAYPSLAALFAILAALVPAPPTRRPESSRGSGGVLISVLVLTMVSAAVPAALRASALRAPLADVPAWAAPFDALVPLHGTVDVLPAAHVCRAELASEQRSVRDHGLACTARAAKDDPSLELRRAEAMVRNGRTEQGLGVAEVVIATYGERRPMLRVVEAEVLRAAGRSGAARRGLEQLLRDLKRRGLTANAEAVERMLGTPVSGEST